MLSFLATPVAFVLKTIHSLLSTFLAPASGPAWALSIVLLTITVRLVLFPLFVKQIKSQRRMQQLAPMIKELQKKHKGDRETLNTEMMKLYKQHNANPISGCLPLVLQLPVFFALFSVMKEFKPGASPKYGLSAELLQEGGRARVFGAPIGAAFNSGSDFLARLGATAGNVRAVAIVMIVLMGATTFWTQRQMMARTGPAADPEQAMVQKAMLYFLPLSFAISGQFFPIGTLLYWLTTNVWSMGQQAYVIKRMPPVVPGGAPEPVAARKDVARPKPERGSGGAGKDADEDSAPTSGGSAILVAPRGGGATPQAPVSAAGNRRPAGSKKRKNGRRGGRR